MASFLIIGVGNTLRMDDGIGAYVCNAIQNMGIEGVDTGLYHQLNTEIIEQFGNHDFTVFVDAAINTVDVKIKKITDIALSPSTQSHSASVELLYSLAKKLYNRDFNIYTCAVPAYNFDMGQQLTDGAKKMADKAIEEICSLIKAKQEA